MPRFDLKDRDPAVPAKTILHPGGRERVFDLPYDTEDPGDIELLRKHPLLVESEIPELEAFEPLPEAVEMDPHVRVSKPKPSRKEVDD